MLDLNLKNLLNILSPVESKWYEIGVQLGIHPSKLQTFELDYRNCGRKFSETLVFWLGGNTDISVTWESIVNALNSPSVNEKGLALKVRDTFYQTTAISVPRGNFNIKFVINRSCTIYTVVTIQCKFLTTCR